MIRTVFSTSLDPKKEWQSELLEFSFRRVKQPGELVRLVAAKPGEPAPHHLLSRVYPTLPWDPHPYVRDSFPGYNTAASVLEWVFSERIDCTILLLDANSVLRHAVTEEVEPGQAIATPWPDMPLGQNGPHGLPESFAYLDQVMAASSLELQPIQLPVLIHSRDLLKLAPRWLELMMMIRMECRQATGRSLDADRLAYAIAAAEYQVHHEARSLGVDTNGDAENAPVHHYRRAVESERGEVVWDETTYEPWQRVEPQKASPGPGRDLLTLLEELNTFRESGGELTLLCPQRREGVREARVLDSMLLEIPGQEDSLSLNETAALIWELCDGQSSLADIISELAKQFQTEPENLRADIRATAMQLQEVGAIRLEQVAMA